MLGDNSEKSKNPLKKAMRRRNGKAVAFSAPTYIEASDVEYSSDEEIDEGGFFIDDEETAATTAAAAGETDDAHEAHDEDIVVEPLRPKPKETEEPENVQESQESERHSPETQQSNEEFLDAEGRKACHFLSKAKDLLTLWQMVPSAGPEMALCGIRIPSSRTTRLNQRRSP